MTPLRKPMFPPTNARSEGDVKGVVFTEFLEMVEEKYSPEASTESSMRPSCRTTAPTRQSARTTIGSSGGS